MKILNLTIFDAKNVELQRIPFKESGLSVIFGNITEREEKKSTSNSLGKSILLKMIDYIFGADKDKGGIIKKELTGYRILAQVKFKDAIYNVERIFTKHKKSNPDEIFINGKSYDLSDYKDFFEIERKYFSPQILLQQKINEIYSQGNAVTKGEYVVFLASIGLVELSEVAGLIATKQKQLDTKKSLVKELSPSNDLRKLKKDILKNKQRRNQELENITLKLEEVKGKVSTLQTSAVTGEMVAERDQALNIVKELKLQIQLDEREIENLNKFMAVSEKSIKPDLIKQMFEDAQQIIPDMIKKRLDDVYLFNKSVFEDRSKFLREKISDLSKQIDESRLTINEHSQLADRLGIIISDNQEYQAALKIYEKYSNDYNRITLNVEKANAVDKVVEEIIALTREVKEDLFIHARNVSEGDSYKKLIEKYLIFVKNFVDELYEDKSISTFDIQVRNPSEKDGAVVLSMNIDAEGEGVGNVKNNILDYLIFNFSQKTEFLIQDTPCFNGIDPRQIVNMIKLVNEQAVKVDKQFIVAINKYQIDDSIKDDLDYLRDHAIITLSEKEKLLKRDF